MRIDDNYKWLARDEDGELYAFEAKPYKAIEGDGFWDVKDDEYYEVEETDDTYSFIEWNDKEPYSVEDAQMMVGLNEVSQSLSSIGSELIDMGVAEEEQPNMVTKPSHYIGINGLEVEQILEEFLPKIEDSYVSHRIGSAVEYLLRSSSKNGIQDIKKAKRNLEQVIAYDESKVKPKEVVEEPEPVKQPTDDHLNDFLACLRGIKVMEDKNMEKVSTFYAGTNPLD